MNKYNTYLITSLALAHSGASYALDPASIDYEGIEITPVVEVSGTYDDNYRAIKDGTDSWIATIAPGVTITAYGDKTIYELKSGLKRENYTAQGTKNLTSYFAKGTGTFNFDIRNKLDLEIGYSKTKSVANALVVGTVNNFKETNFGASYVYGAPSATGNIELGVNHVIYRSGNGINLDQERDSNAFRAAFLYKVTDKTKLVAEINGSQFDYVTNTALDSTNIAYLLGAQWEATAKTTGYAKIGSETKDFDNPNQKNTDLTRWEVSVDWMPLSYSTITLTTNQQIEEGSYGASSTDTVNSGLQWKHDWGRGYASEVYLSSKTDDYKSVREDTTNAIGASITYNIRRWADIAFDYQYSDRTSTDNTQEYDRNIFKLTFNVGL